MATLAEGARVTATEVKEIIPTDYSDALVNAFVNTAHQVVDDNLLSAGVAAGTLTQIELWLAAHLVAVSDQREVRVSEGDSETEYHRFQAGLGLAATLYGQQVKVLDWTGRLSALGNKRAVIEVY